MKTDLNSNQPAAAGSLQPDCSEKVVVYAGRHYGQVHRVIARTGNMLRVQFIDEVFEVPECDAEPLSPNVPDQRPGANTPGEPRRTENHE
jgi:hypothetical protein